MKERLKAAVIFDAFKDTLDGTLPRNEKDYPDWYKFRLNKCAKCKYNTKNIPLSYQPIHMFVASKIGKSQCSICGCFIKQKAWARTEICGMGEKTRPGWLPYSYVEDKDNEVPAWGRLDMVTVDENEFNLLCNDQEKYSVGLEEPHTLPDGTKEDFSSEYRIDLFEKKHVGEMYEFSFGFQSENKLWVTAVHGSCGCTSTELKTHENNKQELGVRINTGNFRENEPFTKDITIRYKIEGKDYSGYPEEVRRDKDGNETKYPSDGDRVVVRIHGYCLNRKA